MVGITLWLFNIEYATTIACVIGLTGLIPLLGIYVGGIIGAVMLLLLLALWMLYLCNYSGDTTSN